MNWGTAMWDGSISNSILTTAPNSHPRNKPKSSVFEITIRNQITYNEWISNLYPFFFCLPFRCFMGKTLYFGNSWNIFGQHQSNCLFSENIFYLRSLKERIVNINERQNLRQDRLWRCHKLSVLHMAFLIKLLIFIIYR